MAATGDGCRRGRPSQLGKVSKYRPVFRAILPNSKKLHEPDVRSDKSCMSQMRDRVQDMRRRRMRARCGVGNAGTHCGAGACYGVGHAGASRGIPIGRAAAVGFDCDPRILLPGCAVVLGPIALPAFCGCRENKRAGGT